MHTVLLLAPWLGSVAVAAVAAATDLRSGRIPNALTYPALVAGPLWHACTRGSPALCEALFGLFATGLGPALLHRRGAMGGGDVKLFAAIGGLLGAGAALEVQWLSLCLIALQALVLAAYRRQLRATLGLILRRWRRADVLGAAPLPAGVPQELRMGGAIFLACLIVGTGAGGAWP